MEDQHLILLTACEDGVNLTFTKREPYCIGGRSQSTTIKGRNYTAWVLSVDQMEKKGLEADWRSYMPIEDDEDDDYEDEDEDE